MGEYLLKSGQLCESIIFIKTGSMRAFYPFNDETGVNLLLRSKSEFLTDYESFITNQPSKMSIQAIEPSELIILPRKKLLTLYDSSFYWNKIGRIIAEMVYLECKSRTEEFLFLTPEQRYLKLMSEKAHYFQLYPLKHLASYLGITPQSLSRIRKRVANPH